MTAATHDPSNPEHVRSARVSEKNYAETLDADLARVMGGLGGRRLIAEVLDWTGLKVRLPDGADVSYLTRHAGHRDIGLQLDAWLERVCPADYYKLRQEERARDE